MTEDLCRCSAIPQNVSPASSSGVSDLRTQRAPLRRQILMLGLGPLLLPRAGTAQPADFPNRPMHIVVPSASGGVADSYARILGKAAAEMLGQSIVVDNKPGAGSVIGTDAVAKSKGDGYTLLMGSLPLSTNPGLMPRLPYDALKDLRPVMQVSGQGFVMSVGSKQPYKSLAELLTVARQREMPYATPGIGTVGHLAGLMFNVEYGTKFVHVAYRGSAPAIQDVIAGQVAVIFDPVGTTTAAVQGGHLRPIAVTNPTRLSGFATTATLRELGFPAAEAVAYSGLLVPASTPDDIVRKLNTVFNQVARLPEVKAAFERMHVPLVGGPPEVFGNLIRSETERWVPLIKRLGLKAE